MTGLAWAGPAATVALVGSAWDTPTEPIAVVGADTVGMPSR